MTLLKSLQSKARERLVSKFPDLEYGGISVDNGEMADFLDSEIQTAVEAERNRIADWLIDEGYLKEKKLIEQVKPKHGNCCTCQTCGHYHDECVCENNRIFRFLFELSSLTKSE